LRGAGMKRFLFLAPLLFLAGCQGESHYDDKNYEWHHVMPTRGFLITMAICFPITIFLYRWFTSQGEEEAIYVFIPLASIVRITPLLTFTVRDHDEITKGYVKEMHFYPAYRSGDASYDDKYTIKVQTCTINISDCPFKRWSIPKDFYDTLKVGDPVSI